MGFILFEVRNCPFCWGRVVGIIILDVALGNEGDCGGAGLVAGIDAPGGVSQP